MSLLTDHICATQYIPLAENWMRAAADQDLFLHSEVKVHDQEVQQLLTPPLDATDRMGLNPSQVRISSFSYDVIQLIRGCRPELDVGIATVRLADVPLNALESLGVVSVHLDIDYLDCQAIESAVGRGFKVFVYTVNSAKQLASLTLDLIDSVFTDDPLRLLDELKALKNVK